MTAWLPEDALRTGTAQEAARLRAALARIGEVSDDAERRDHGGVDAPCADGAYAGEPQLGRPVGTLRRLWQDGGAVGGDEASVAFGLGAERLVELGLLRRSGEGKVAAEVVLGLHEGRWFAYDSSNVRPGPAGANFVMPVSGSSLSLLGCLPSGRFRCALDVGTGCGIQAVVLAGRCGAVVATDVNRRALSMARFNAWLNGATNVEFRHGSLVEPVAGERFDLVAANPPFVVSPDTAQLYRDGPGGGDELCRSLVHDSATALAPGGMGVFLVNWARRGDEDPFAVPRSWIDGTGLCALVLHHFSEDGETYARRWLGGEAEAGPAEVTRWTDHYQALGITSIAMGIVVVTRPVTGHAPPWFTTFAAPLRRTDSKKGDHLRQLLALQAFLHGEADDVLGPRPLLDRVLRPADGHELVRTYRWRDEGYHPDGARARLGVGFPFAVTLDPGSAELLSRCDGRRRFGDVVAGLAAELGIHPDEVAQRAQPSVRTLIAMGFLVPPEVHDVTAPAATAGTEVTAA